MFRLQLSIMSEWETLRLWSDESTRTHTHSQTYVMFTHEAICLSLPLKPGHPICPVTLLSPFFLPLQLPSPFQENFLSHTHTQQKDKKMTEAVMSLSKVNHRERRRRSGQGLHKVTEVCIMLTGHHGNNSHSIHRVQQENVSLDESAKIDEPLQLLPSDLNRVISCCGRVKSEIKFFQNIQIFLCMLAFCCTTAEWCYFSSSHFQQTREKVEETD